MRSSDHATHRRRPDEYDQKPGPGRSHWMFQVIVIVMGVGLLGVASVAIGRWAAAVTSSSESDGGNAAEGPETNVLATVETAIGAARQAVGARPPAHGRELGSLTPTTILTEPVGTASNLEDPEASILVGDGTQPPVATRVAPTTEAVQPNTTKPVPSSPRSDPSTTIGTTTTQPSVPLELTEVTETSSPWPSSASTTSSTPGATSSTTSPPTSTTSTVSPTTTTQPAGTTTSTTPPTSTSTTSTTPPSSTTTTSATTTSTTTTSATTTSTTTTSTTTTSTTTTAPGPKNGTCPNGEPKATTGNCGSGRDKPNNGKGHPLT